VSLSVPVIAAIVALLPDRGYSGVPATIELSSARDERALPVSV